MGLSKHSEAQNCRKQEAKYSSDRPVIPIEWPLEWNRVFAFEYPSVRPWQHEIEIKRQTKERSQQGDCCRNSPKEKCEGQRKREQQTASLSHGEQRPCETTAAKFGSAYSIQASPQYDCAYEATDGLPHLFFADFLHSGPRSARSLASFCAIEQRCLRFLL